MATCYQNFGANGQHYRNADATEATTENPPQPVYQLQAFDQAARVAPAFEKSLVKGDAPEPGHGDGDDADLVN